MITIIYSTHKDSEYNKNFKNHLSNTIGVKDFEIIEFINNGEFSLSELYNKGINSAKNDIVVCCHNDIELSKNWGKHLINDFDKNPEFGIIGKAGTSYFPSSGIFWEKKEFTMVGQVYHNPEKGKKWLSSYSPKLPIIVPVVSIDGLFISFNIKKIKHKFDESFGKFHFYDHGFCIPNYIDGVKIGVTSSFEITHKSIGVPNEEFFKTKDIFVEKYKNVLPIDLKPDSVFFKKVNTKIPKKIGLTAVIILTKGKTNLLFNCINSFIENCNSSLYEIFIADTGSNEQEKKDIKYFIDKNIDNLKIHFIEYDYYNFAKINNDVVKNIIGDKFKFILFCNNDIVLLNDVLTGMLDIFCQKNKVGTVGCRLHYENNLVQHDGIASLIIKNEFHVTHHGLSSYYSFLPYVKNVSGNTAALMMIRLKTFQECGGFNENYIGCLEDVELNYTCIIKGLDNYNDGSLVAYHYESQTRNDENDKESKFAKDYALLLSFVKFNFDKIKRVFGFYE